MKFSFASLVLAVATASSEVTHADLTAALDSDDECRTIDCALELAQLRVAKRHRDAPEEATQAPQADASAADGSAAAPVTGKDFGHPDWISDCRRVFIDLGCNNGVNIRKLYEPRKFPDAKLLPVFEEQMGSAGWRRAPGKQNGMCALGLEPNPDHFERLQKLEAAYSEHGWHVHFYPFAAFNTEGMMAFNKSTQRPSEVDKVTGAGAHLAMKSEETEGTDKVRTVNAAEFVNSLPEGSVKLVVMDIEGAEYETLAQMMQENVLCNTTVERLLVETHGWGDVTHWGGSESFADGTHPRSFQAVVERMNQLKGVNWCKPAELSQVDEFDDATYSEDVDDMFAQYR